MSRKKSDAFKHSSNFLKLMHLLNQNWFSIYFNFSYFILYSSFHISQSHKSSRNRSFIIKRNVIQQIICGLLSTLGALYTINELRQVFNNDKMTPASYLNVVSATSTFFFQHSVRRIFWFNQSQVVEIINYYATSGLKSNVNFSAKIFYPFLCVVYTLLPFMTD